MSEMTLHPDRYPVHPDPTKGQVLGGVCNVTTCDREHAVHWNCMTRGFYCHRCAMGVNFHIKGNPICKEVECKPSLIEMDDLHKAYMKGLSRG